jgi:hypothetical protein
MARYKVITLVDITRANPDRKEIDKLKLGQQANFNSLLQAIELRANVSWEIDPRQHSGSLPLPLVGKAVHWSWEFEVEQEDVFKQDNDHVALLKKDLHGVPVINQLNNSVDLYPSAFQTEGKNSNIWVYILD